MKLEFKTTNDYVSWAYDWYMRLPEFITNFGQFNQNRNLFENDLKKGVNYIGLADGKPFGLVHGQHIDNRIVEGHLFCEKSVSEDLLTQLVIYAKCQALTSYDQVLTHVLTKHKILHKIMHRAGFNDTGYRGWYYVYRGQLLEVKYYLAE